MVSDSASSIECYWSNPDWAMMAYAGWVAGVLYVVGVPLTFLVVLVVGKRLAHHQNFLCFRADSRRAGMHDPHYEQMFGGLYSGFHFHSYLLEGWNLLRKLALVVSGGQLAGYPILQMAAQQVEDGAGSL